MIVHVGPHAPEWIRLAAAAVLAVHIAAAGIGLLAGAAALTAAKGSALHRRTGRWFAVAMLTMTAIGAATAPLLPQQTSVIAGLFTFYLVATGWMAAIRRTGPVGKADAAGLAFAVATAALAVGFGLYAAGAPGGRLGGDPPTSYYGLALLPALTALADAWMIRRGEQTRRQWLARHIWRMCTALLIAAFSLFVGQPKVFPVGLRGSPILLLPEVLVLGTMIFWLVRLRAPATSARMANPGTTA